MKDKNKVLLWSGIGVVLIGLALMYICLLSGCFDSDIDTHTHVCYGTLTDVFTDGTMASLDFVNGSGSGITFYGSPNEAYDSFDFKLLEIGAEYTFVFHLEDDVMRPGNEAWYIDNAPVIDKINRGNHIDYWLNSRGCIKW